MTLKKDSDTPSGKLRKISQELGLEKKRRVNEQDATSTDAATSELAKLTGLPVDSAQSSESTAEPLTTEPDDGDNSDQGDATTQEAVQVTDNDVLSQLTSLLEPAEADDSDKVDATVQETAEVETDPIVIEPDGLDNPSDAEPEKRSLDSVQERLAYKLGKYLRNLLSKKNKQKKQTGKKSEPDAQAVGESLNESQPATATEPAAVEEQIVVGSSEPVNFEEPEASEPATEQEPPTPEESQKYTQKDINKIIIALNQRNKEMKDSQEYTPEFLDFYKQQIDALLKMVSGDPEDVQWDAKIQEVIKQIEEQMQVYLQLLCFSQIEFPYTAENRKQIADEHDGIAADLDSLKKEIKNRVESAKKTNQEDSGNGSAELSKIFSDDDKDVLKNEAVEVQLSIVALVKQAQKDEDPGQVKQAQELSAQLAKVIVMLLGLGVKLY